jgi:hypothetical protein
VAARPEERGDAGIEARQPEVHRAIVLVRSDATVRDERT